MTKTAALQEAAASRNATSGEDGDGWLESFLPYQLYRVSSLMNMRLQGRLRAMGVNLSRWRVLSVLQANGRSNLSQIVDLTLMEQPTVSRVVANLESEGLVDRRLSADDSRMVEAALTPKGAALFAEIHPHAVSRQRSALQGLSDDELSAFRTTLERIELNIARDL